MQRLRFLWYFFFGGGTAPDDLERRLQESSARIAELENRARRAEEAAAAGRARMADQDARLLDQDGRIDALQREVAARDAAIAEREAAIAERDATIAALRARLESGEAAPVASPEPAGPGEKAGEPAAPGREEARAPAPSAPAGASGPSAPAAPHAGLIARFMLPGKGPAFDARPGSALKAVTAALEIGPLLRLVETSADKKAPTLAKQLKKHEEGLRKLRDSLSQTPAAGEAPVEAIAGEYFGIFQRIFLNNILLAVYRGLKNGNPFYTGLVAPVTDYLAACGFSTRDVVPGRAIRDEDYEDMHLYLKKTDSPELDNVIFEVERLPYYLRYLNEEGEEMSLCCQGALTLYKREQ